MAPTSYTENNPGTGVGKHTWMAVATYVNFIGYVEDYSRYIVSKTQFTPSGGDYSVYFNSGNHT